MEAAQDHLRFHRRVALEALHRHQVGEELRHLVQLGDLALDEQGHFLRVQAAGQIVQRHFDDVLTDLLGVVGIVGKCLYISDEHKHPVIVSFILEENPVAERAHIVAQVEFAGRTVAGKDDSSHLSFTVYSSRSTCSTCCPVLTALDSASSAS